MVSFTVGLKLPNVRLSHWCAESSRISTLFPQRGQGIITCLAWVCSASWFSSPWVWGFHVKSSGFGNLQGDSGSLPNQKKQNKWISYLYIYILITVSSITYLCIWIDPVTSLSITQTASAQGSDRGAFGYRHSSTLLSRWVYPLVI